MTDEQNETPRDEAAPSNAGFDASLFSWFEERERREETAYEEYVRGTDYTTDLRGAFDSYQETSQFALGSLVQWKPLLRNRQFPGYGAPAIVVGFITPNEEDHNDIEPDDVILGYLTGRQDFAVASYASKRFTSWD